MKYSFLSLRYSASNQLKYFLKSRFPSPTVNFINLDKGKIQVSYLHSTKMTQQSLGKILITRPDVPSVALDILRDRCDLIIWDQANPIPRSTFLSKIKDVDGVFCMLTDKIDDQVLTAAGSQLKVVATMSVGVDHLDLGALKKRNIYVGYTPGILTDATAELIIGLLLATSRRLLEANKAVHEGEWKGWAPTWMCGPGLAGSVIGIVGLGKIGCQVGKIIKHFNVEKILYTSRSIKEEASTFDGSKVELDELLSKSDFVIVTVSLTEETKYLFNKKKFEQMKRTAIFINASRGEVVDQSALIEALKTGTIRAAGLDVMTPEPIPLDSELLKLNNCLILPHIGSATTETREQMAKMTAQNILSALSGKPNEMPAQFIL